MDGGRMTLPALWDCQDCVAEGRKHVGIMAQYDGRYTTLYECTVCGHLQRLPMSLQAYNETPSQDKLMKEVEGETWVFQEWVVDPHHNNEWRNDNE
jgi:hypothetical protein